MSFIDKKISWKKSILVAAISSALMLAGCAGDDGEDGANGAPGLSGPAGTTGPTGPTGADGIGTGEADDGTAAAAFAYTTSGFSIYEDAIFVSDYFGSMPQDGDDISDAIIEAVFDLKDGQTLVLPQGRFNVSKTISIIDKQNITFTGYGIYETQLDFSGSTESGDAIKFQGGSDLEIRDFSVFEANKNGIKIDKANGVYLAYTAAIWEGELSSDNGAYGLYPVGSQNVLLEYNYSYGSADAGIYVGQSNNIVVRHNVAKNNVAGIEIENSTNADVYKNLATANTGGILVFDLPGLEKAFGGNVRVFDNDMIANNTLTVAPVSSTVGLVPPGTGFLNLAASNVEIYHNRFKDNHTASIELSSYFLVDDNFANYSGKHVPTMLAGWNPNFTKNYIHDNVIERSGANPDGYLVKDYILVPGIDEAYPQFTMFNGFSGVTLELAPDPETFEATPTGGVVDNTGKTPPAILFAGIGQFIINETDSFAELYALTGDSFLPYPAEDGVCLSNNIDGNSLASFNEFGDATIGTVFPSKMADAVNGIAGGLPAPIFKTEVLHGDTSSFACTQKRLPAATVTFRGKKYGCAGDDAATHSCNL
ncbi:parallel beta-helix domain-containing protein [Colwelliaceae bacterium BS250]